jgi:hypothetical protein
MRRVIFALACALAGCVPAADVEPDAIPSSPRKPTVVYSSQIGNAEGQASDSDFAADPPADDPEARAANVKANNEAALAAATAGQFGRHRPYSTPEKAIECEQLLGAAESAVPAAAAEMLNNSCGRDDSVRSTECPAVAALVSADGALAEAKCPKRPRYPTLRDK